MIVPGGRSFDRTADFRLLPGVAAQRNHSFFELAFKRIPGRLDCVSETNRAPQALFALIQRLNQFLNQRT
jgi:hypothetical protein